MWTVLRELGESQACRDHRVREVSRDPVVHQEHLERQGDRVNAVKQDLPDQRDQPDRQDQLDHVESRVKEVNIKILRHKSMIVTCN